MSIAERKRSAIIRYGGALAIIAVATMLRFWLDQPLAGGGFMIFCVAVIVASWFGGLGPSLVALVLTLAVSAAFFGNPPDKPPDPPVRALAGLALFFFMGLTTAVLSESMRAAQRRAEDADRRKDEFLAILAHELRNPLAPISMGLDLLRRPGVDAATVQWAHDVMERQVQHLVRLVDDLLDVSRIMRGKIELRNEPVELRTLVTRAIETVQAAIDAKGHELAVSLPDQPVTLVADPVRLSQVIGNLLANAAKYTPPGGRIWLAAEQADGAAVVRVRDTGIGIAPEMLPRVFDLFAQASASGAQGGLGIGLTLVKNLVELSGGAVEAHSAGLGKGSEFVVRLPVAEAIEPARLDHELPAVAIETAARRRRVFVVDDNADAARALTELLRLEGHEVQAFHDGPSALKAAEAAAPEVVLLDLGMPEMDGLEVARRLRQSPTTGNALLIAVTGWGQQADRQRTQAAGFDHHLVKPVDADVLRELLARSDSEHRPDHDAATIAS